MQIKITTRDHYISMKLVKIKTSDTPNTGEAYRKARSLMLLGMSNGIASQESSVAASLKN